MPWKQIVSKRPRVETPTPSVDYVPTFHTQVVQECYERLSHRRFGESREIDWDVLHEVSLEIEVQQLLSAGAWLMFFQITNNTYEEMVL